MQTVSSIKVKALMDVHCDYDAIRCRN